MAKLSCVYIYYIELVNRVARLQDRRFKFQFPAGTKDFSVLQNVQLDPRPIQRPIKWVPRDYSPVVKRSGREADHSLYQCRG
jgi:hypothetical protein